MPDSNPHGDLVEQWATLADDDLIPSSFTDAIRELAKEVVYLRQRGAVERQRRAQLAAQRIAAEGHGAERIYVLPAGSLRSVGRDPCPPPDVDDPE